jgi:RecQ family ATP-dependent DNA helicase
MKGRGSKAGGVKPMGWKKKFDRFKSKGSKKSGKCFRCGKAGHWSQDCPSAHNSDLSTKSKDGEDNLDLVMDTLILSTPLGQSADHVLLPKVDAKGALRLEMFIPQNDLLTFDFSDSMDPTDLHAVEAKTREPRSRKRNSDVSDCSREKTKPRTLRGNTKQSISDSANVDMKSQNCQAVLQTSTSSEAASTVTCSTSAEHSIDALDATCHSEFLPEALVGKLAAFTGTKLKTEVYGPDNIKDTLQELFGHDDFRTGQQEALERVLSGKSTLFISATGGGKSLCYQLPAYKLDGTTLVVSPLLSLIQDQMEHLPASIRGATLNSQQSQEEYQTVIQSLRNGEVDVLFVAPERLFTDAFLAVARCLPPFPLVCIDEVHCISEWAHNFRPSYLRLRPLLRDTLRARCILGLTATATKSMEREIISALGIEPEGIIRSDVLRPNLRLTVSRDKNRQLGTLDMLQKDPRFKKGPVIVYCSLRTQCEDLAKYLKGQSVSADFYHAGRTSKDRQLIQNRFFSGKIRVVVATVAFGMGLDKSNIRGIIHYSCPQSIEGYVQEIGRAGRDGETAFCHLFLNEEEQSRLSSLAHGEGIELCNIRRVVDHVLVGPISSGNARPRQLGDYIQVDEDTDVLFDIPKESLETILCFLEQEHLVEVCNPTAARITISFLTTQQRELEQSSRVIAAILSLSSPRNGQWTFVPTAIANHLKMGIAEVNKELRSLKAQRLLRVEWLGRSLTCRILPGPSELSRAAEEVSAVIHERFAALECRKVARLLCLQRMLESVAQDSWINANEEVKSLAGSSVDQDCSESHREVGILASMISDYFAKDNSSDDRLADATDSGLCDASHGTRIAVSNPQDKFLRADIINFIHSIKSDNPLITG